MKLLHEMEFESTNDRLGHLKMTCIRPLVTLIEAMEYFDEYPESVDNLYYAFRHIARDMELFVDKWLDEPKAT